MYKKKITIPIKQLKCKTEKVILNLKIVVTLMMVMLVIKEIQMSRNQTHTKTMVRV